MMKALALFALMSAPSGRDSATTVMQLSGQAIAHWLHPMQRSSPCSGWFLRRGTPPKNPNKPCAKRNQRQPLFDGTAAFYNSKVVRASAGSIFRLPHVSGVGLEEAVEALRSKQISILGTVPTAATTIEQWDWRKPVAVFVGNEGSGLSEEELGHCDTVLRIPHGRAVESLNSAIATAVILYEASRQRR